MTKKKITKKKAKAKAKKPARLSTSRRAARTAFSAEARTFERQIVAEYRINDAAGLKLLARACEALDRLRRAQRLIARDGEVIGDKKGSVKAHPAIAIEKEAHRQFMEALKALNLDLEPLRDHPGRPGGGR